MIERPVLADTKECDASPLCGGCARCGASEARHGRGCKAVDGLARTVKQEQKPGRSSSDLRAASAAFCVPGCSAPFRHSKRDATSAGPSPGCCGGAGAGGGGAISDKLS